MKLAASETVQIIKKFERPKLEVKISKYAKHDCFSNVDKNIKDFMNFCQSFLKQQNRGSNLKSGDNVECMKDLMDY